ncbi:hypothetical protein [Enterococcus avium]|uniref:hypothetical protein n=1 Tax=Enterococcus avium TaxID=33945 RepID=UPI0022E51381|nr:hypothetical protein [Enterococcus avium]
MERAVLLSDIEFLDGVHESDWERIEEESFLVNVSKPLNENQQVVLEWLKKKIDSYLDVSYLIGDLNYFAATPVGQAWKRLSKAEQFQVLAAFAEWGSKEEQS